MYELRLRVVDIIHKFDDYIHDLCEHPMYKITVNKKNCDSTYGILVNNRMNWCKHVP